MRRIHKKIQIAKTLKPILQSNLYCTKKKQDVRQSRIFYTRAPVSFYYTIIISSAVLTYVNQLYVLVVEELERHGHVFQLLRPERRPFVVLGQSLAAEHLDERNQPETVAQVRFQIADGLSGRLQVLIGPSGKRVLLDELPARVLGQVPFGGSHVVLLTAGFVSVRIVRRGRRRRHCRHS